MKTIDGYSLLEKLNNLTAGGARCVSCGKDVDYGTMYCDKCRKGMGVPM